MVRVRNKVKDKDKDKDKDTAKDKDKDKQKDKQKDKDKNKRKKITFLGMLLVPKERVEEAQRRRGSEAMRLRG